jgi:hypothetical protein
VGGPLFINTPEYVCTNPICQSGKKSKKLSPHSPEVWRNYPPKVRARYDQYMYTAISDGENGELLVTEEFCRDILDHLRVFNEHERRYGEAFEANKRSDICAYKEFVESEKLVNEENQRNPVEDGAFEELWPKFGESRPQAVAIDPASRNNRYDRDFLYPKKNKMSDVYTSTFNLIEKYLLHDLYSRTPGQFTSWDATFKFLSKTGDHDKSGEENNALHLVHGMYGHILIFAFAHSGQSLVFQRLHNFLRQRYLRVGGINKVNKLEYGYCDTCCEGLKDPMRHLFFLIWPGAKKWPMQDLFHGMKGITSETLGPSSDLNAVFTAALSNGCLEFDEAGKTAAAEKYIKDKKAILTIEIAKEKAMSVPSYKKTITNSVPSGEVLAEAINTAYSNIKKLDNRRAQQASDANRGYWHYIKRGIPDHQIGTDKAVENAKMHAGKGCWSDPLPMEKMNIPIDPEDLRSEKL